MPPTDGVDRNFIPTLKRIHAAAHPLAMNGPVDHTRLSKLDFVAYALATGHVGFLAQLTAYLVSNPPGAALTTFLTTIIPGEHINLATQLRGIQGSRLISRSGVSADIRRAQMSLGRTWLLNEFVEGLAPHLFHATILSLAARGDNHALMDYLDKIDAMIVQPGIDTLNKVTGINLALLVAVHANQPKVVATLIRLVGPQQVAILAAVAKKLGWESTVAKLTRLASQAELSLTTANVYFQSNVVYLNLEGVLHYLSYGEVESSGHGSQTN
ncbi:hypothetical protein IWQ60_004991 [Tieghemiomyces parasiticus]|uniref:Uncharacterized protein n=1 Tax=Tieghemiomyces parasiticus TaxID=78921 RepID=A0A9W8A7T4_9FUNG|nr:hypothetical protein IWQ60_004991 [Tieghemiomyces parasiticus]